MYSVSEVLIRIWYMLDDLCEKYLKAHKEAQ